MSNRNLGPDGYSRMKAGESKKCLAIVQRRRDTAGRTGAKMAMRAAVAAKDARADAGGKKK